MDNIVQVIGFVVFGTALAYNMWNGMNQRIEEIDEPEPVREKPRKRRLVKAYYRVA
jgi:hypothetical protein